MLAKNVVLSFVLVAVLTLAITIAVMLVVPKQRSNCLATRTERVHVYLRKYNTVRAHLNGDAWPRVTFGAAAPAPYTHAFNGSLIGDKYVARLEKNPFYQTRRISISDWNGGNPTNPRLVKFKTQNGQAEDPRTFSFNGRPACAFNDGKRMYVGFLDDETCYKLRAPVRTGVNTIEKNWSPFMYNNKLHFLYNPGHVVEFAGTNPARQYLSTPPTLPCKAAIRGGTQVVQHGDKLYTIFHAVQRLHGPFKLYWAGLLELDSTPPFAACRWSKEPLWKASWVDATQIPPTYWTRDKPMKTMVTFPTHLEIDQTGNMFILAGYHDTTDQIICLHLQDVLRTLE